MSKTTEQLALARRLAFRAQHTSAFDAAALVRAWPPLAEAALSVHRSVAGEQDVDRTIERIAWDARALTSAMERPAWPTLGDRDAALLQVTRALKRGTELATKTSAPADEAQFAGRLVISTLWSTAQLVSQSLSDHAFDLRSSNDSSAPRELLVVKDLFKRFEAVQQLASAALGTPQDYRPEPSKPVMQLRQAIAVWDVEAHRALLGDRSTAVLHVMSHLEADSVKALEHLVGQAAGTGVIDQVTAGRLSPILSDSSMSWTRLRDVAADLSFSSVPPAMPFIQAGKNLQQQLRGAATGSASDDHAQILVALSGHLASSVTIAAATRELITSGELRAPAQAVARVFADHYRGRQHPPVDAVAIHRRLTIPLNLDARNLLGDLADRVFVDAHEAVNRSAGLDALYRSPSPGHQAMRPDQHGIQRPRTPVAMQQPATPSGPAR